MLLSMFDIYKDGTTLEKVKSSIQAMLLFALYCTNLISDIMTACTFIVTMRHLSRLTLHTPYFFHFYDRNWSKPLLLFLILFPYYTRNINPILLNLTASYTQKEIVRHTQRDRVLSYPTILPSHPTMRWFRLSYSWVSLPRVYNQYLVDTKVHISHCNMMRPCCLPCRLRV